MPPRSHVVVLALLVPALLLGACRPGPRPVPEPPAESVLHGIDITLDNDRCRYYVLGPVENEDAPLNPQLQDSFAVQPLDELLFRAEEGVLISVRVHESPEGVPGLAGDAQARELRAHWQPRVREPVGYPTGHQIDISCCLPAGHAQCEMQPAESATDDDGMGSRYSPPSHDLSRHGPAENTTSVPDDEPIRPGGPKMIVME